MLNPPARTAVAAWREFAAAPLAPVALAAAGGLCVDRYVTPTFAAELAAAAVALLAWAFAQKKPLVLFAVAAVFAAYHHRTRFDLAADDIARSADPPAVAAVRGILDDEPLAGTPLPTDRYGPGKAMDRAAVTLNVTHLRGDTGWTPASGKLRATVERTAAAGEASDFADLHPGDAVELVGRLHAPDPPRNPGEADRRATLADRGVRAEMHCRGDNALVRLATDDWHPGAVTVRIRGRMTRTLDAALPAREAGLARALLLGDGTAMDRAEWDAFARTGVVHVLAISGQHLVILAGFVWWGLRLADVRRKRGAVFVILLIVGYAVLTGLRPSAVRAAVAVVGAGGAVLLGRTPHPANLFAAAFLAVSILDPTDPFSVGCQLSFAGVFALIWGVGRWLTPAAPDPLAKLIDESRPAWVRAVRRLGRWVLDAYLISLALTAASAPLVMYRLNVAPPAGVLLGPPLVLLTGIALLFGFAALLLGLLSTTLAAPFAAVAGGLLEACAWLVHLIDGVPGAGIYVPPPPLAWVLGFYGLLAALALCEPNWRVRLGVALAAWSAAGLIGVPKASADELRVTVLAVGHGGAAVIETPDGRTVVYDAGAMAGGDVTRRVIAPYLWDRGLTRVDELILSHADLDHFNGAPGLLRRFPVGRATLTPSFALKPTPEVAETLAALRAAGVAPEPAVAGATFTAGAVTFEVLHPPAGEFGATENERSLVVRVAYAGHAVLLTGDLEKAGTEALLRQPRRPAAVMLAPHHGSRGANPAAVAAWAGAKLLIASKADRDGGVLPADVPGATVWDTPTTGAVTVRINRTGVVAEAFRTGEVMVVERSRP